MYAEVRASRARAEVDDDDFVALRHASGAISHLWMSHTAAQEGPRLRVLGARDAYVKWGLDPQEDALKAGGVPGGPGWGEEADDRWGTTRAGPVKTEAGAYPALYRDLVAAIRAGAPPPATPQEAAVVLEVIEAAFVSWREGRVVRV